MSYDLMVFRKESAPKTRAGFMEWYSLQTQWKETHGYDDPSNTSLELKAWFLEMIQYFPAMNGPYATEDDEDDDNDMITGYTIGHNVIYVDFRWSVAEEAYEKTIALAEKHQVGFFDVSSDEGDILFPENGRFIPIEDLTNSDEIKSGKKVTSRPWWRFW